MRFIGALVCGLGVFAFGGQASAGELVGTWMRDDGLSKIRMSHCGDAICGHVAWLKDKDSPAKVGQQVFFGMKPDGDDSWSGKAFNPEDGKTYVGKASVSGSSMTTKGCVLGGLLCKSYAWSRSN